MRGGMGTGWRGLGAQRRLGVLGFLQAGNEMKDVFNTKRHHFLLIFSSQWPSTAPRATHFAGLLHSGAQRRTRDQDSMVADTELDRAGATATTILQAAGGGHLAQTAHLLLFNSTRTPGRRVSADLQNTLSKKTHVTHFCLYPCRQHANCKSLPKLLSVTAA